MILVGIGSNRLRVVGFQEGEALQKRAPRLITVKLVGLGSSLQESRSQKNSHKKQPRSFFRYRGESEQINEKTSCQPQEFKVPEARITTETCSEEQIGTES